MTEHFLVGVASIIVLGIGAQWLAWRLGLPSILLLLVFGFLAGPVFGLLHPDALLGGLLAPVVSLSVAVILFEGGLSLRFADLRVTGGVVRGLIGIGTAVTWLITAGAAHWMLGLDVGLAVLLGAILTVTGPTVILPLLQHVRPLGQVGSILRWEGILIDPIGAMLAVLVFEALLAGGFREAAAGTLIAALKTVLLGGIMGILAAQLLVLLLQHFWIPDHLHNAVSLALLVGVFTATNLLQVESGLLAATVMGITLANQENISVKHIVEFKENLTVLLVSSLFILLAARLQLTDLLPLRAEPFLLVAVLVLVARPTAVALSSIGSDLSWRERAFLACMAPRGIVAAAVASLFALRLREAGNPQAASLVPLTFLVIIGTVTIYGLCVSPVARWLKVARPNPQGCLMVGAHAWARVMAKALQAEGFLVLLVDTNHKEVTAARMDGVPAFYASILSDSVLDEIELGGIGRLLALTSNDEVNSLAALHFASIFGRARVYQLPPGERSDPQGEGLPHHLRGRLLFGPAATYASLTSRFAAGAAIKTTNLTAEFDFEAFRNLYGERATPLFLVTAPGTLRVIASDERSRPEPGQKLISLLDPIEKWPAPPDGGGVEKVG